MNPSPGPTAADSAAPPNLATDIGRRHSGSDRLCRLLGPTHDCLTLDGDTQALPEGRQYGALLVRSSGQAGPIGLAAQVDRLRRLMRPGGVMALAVDRPAPGLASALRRAGLAAVAGYRVRPSLHDPSELVPLAGSLCWPWSARLLLASDHDASLPLLKNLPSPAGAFAVARLWCSEKGKTLVFGQLQGQATVLRLPHTPEALAAESHAFTVLCRLRQRADLATLLPRARSLGSGAFAESIVRGRPLREVLSRRSRPGFVLTVEHTLAMLNPRSGDSVVSVHEYVTEPLLDRLATATGQSDWWAALCERLRSELEGAQTRLGLVHGDFSVSNIFVHDGRISGLIDWENAQWQAPPVLDALNYLDSVERRCNAVTLAQTLPRLASGDWPVAAELALLRRAFERCGLDWRYRRGLTMLYGLSHIVAQLGFATVGDPVHRRLEDMVRWFIDGPR